MDTKSLDGIFDFMSKAYWGNWQYRFGQNTPYMLVAGSQGKKESILAHQWACMAFWFQIRRVCPELNKVVDTEKLYELIMNHDLGETVKGDLPLVKQMNGEGKDKYLTERDEIRDLGKNLPQGSLEETIALFDKFEQKLEDMDSIEPLVARFLDYLEGDHFALVFGNDLQANSEIIGKIVESRWAVYTQRLTDLLRELKFAKAAEEVVFMANHHLGDIKKAGIEMKLAGFK